MALIEVLQRRANGLARLDLLKRGQRCVIQSLRQGQPLR